MNTDIVEFLKSLSGKSLLEAYTLIDQESREAKRTAKGKRREPHFEYVRKLGGLGFILFHPNNSIRPAGVSASDIAAYKPFLTELVNKGELNKSVLDFS